MKRRATALLAGLLLLSAAGTVQAEINSITVTLTINTSTVQDTLKPGDVVQLRGQVRGSGTEYHGQVIEWGRNSTLIAQNVGGDYWTVSWDMMPGDTLDYKVWTGFSLDPEEVGTNVNTGWETSADRTLIVPADQEDDIELPLTYYNREQRFDAPPENHIGVYFRVNMGAQVALGSFDPENENHRVGMRGQPEGVLGALSWDDPTLFYLQRESQPGTRNHFYGGVIYVHEDSLGRNDGNQMYKFVYETPTLHWESTPDRPLSITQAADTTIHWVFFSGERPPVGEVVTASVQFTVNMGVLEDLGFFDQGVGDEVLLLGGFTPWQWDNNTTETMAFQDVFGVFDKTVSVTRPPGDRLEYKYFVRWHASRFDENSPNYIPGLDSGNGWEEPGATGGGNRHYMFTDDPEQFAGDFGGTVGFFNSIPPEGVIHETTSGNDVMDVTFKLDMTPALTWPGMNFNPAEHGVWIQFDVPFFALTQGIRTGLDGVMDDPSRVQFSPSADGDNIYELTLEVHLPTENHIGFNIVYGDLEGEITTSGNNSFEAGRRYYRYITPASQNNGVIVWPDSDELALIEFKEDADFESPPTYGLDVSSEDDAVLPGRFSLSQNFPNPFNPSTSINYTISQPSDVMLTVYNMLGQRVATLVEGHQITGSHNVRFDGSNLSSGVYIYRLQVDGQIMTKKMVLMK